MAQSKFRRLLLCLAASATTLGVSAPAFAGGSYFSAGYGSGYYGGGGFHSSSFKGHRGFRGHRSFRGHRGYHRGHGRRHGGGGKGAVIALGVIGGAILLSEAARADERRGYARERYYDRRDRYDRRRYRSRNSNRTILRERDNEGVTGDEGGRSDDLDSALEGGRVDRNDGGPAPISISYRGAYATCMTHARKALGDRGFILAAPDRPETAEDAGGAWRITATVSAQNQKGESWNRAMYCEATEDRVFLLELI